QEFAGYWEYVLDEAIFTAPAHPNWGGTAVIGPQGDLLGIGSLHLEQPRGQGTEHLNMIVPIDLLKPILDDLLTLGRRNRPARPWLGLYATEVDNRHVVVGLSSRGPAKNADLRTGDIVVAVQAGAERAARFDYDVVGRPANLSPAFDAPAGATLSFLAIKAFDGYRVGAALWQPGDKVAAASTLLVGVDGSGGNFARAAMN